MKTVRAGVVGWFLANSLEVAIVVARLQVITLPFAAILFFLGAVLLQSWQLLACGVILSGYTAALAWWSFYIWGNAAWRDPETRRPS